MKAVRGTFVKTRTVATRKVAVFEVEVAIEEANAALQSLGGLPDPSNPQWVAIAPITAEAATAPVQSHEKKPMTLPQRVGMLCQQPDFQTFLEKSAKPAIPRHDTQTGADFAAAAVRKLCGVTSRALIRPSTEAGDIWLALETNYDAWRGRIADPRS